MGRTAQDLHHIGNSKNGADIYVDLIHSAAAEHIARNPQMLTLAKESLAAHAVSGARMDIEHDFGRTIGNSEVIQTTSKDTIVYAKRLKKDAYSRFVHKRQMEPSSLLSMSLEQNPENGGYELTDIWVGQQTPPFPAEEDAPQASKLYWEHHAIVLEGQALQLRTVTKNFPY